MMNLRWMPGLAIAVSALGLVGCGGGGGVVAVAPGAQQQLIRRVGGGEFSLYRGTGFDELNRPRRIERLWTTQVPSDGRVGFEWYTDKATMYEPTAALHLIAVAGDQHRDLGSLQRSNERYFWADASANPAVYWQGQAARTVGEYLSMQK